MADLAPLLLVSVGNTRTRFARTVGSHLEPSVCIGNSDPVRLVEEVSRAARAGGGTVPARVVLASVNDPVADRIEAALRGRGGDEAPLVRGGGEGGGGLTVIRVGRDLPVPLEHTLPPPVTVGQDRLLDALGAYTRSHQACVVIDAGTAVTVDFVDGSGVFHGGAIAPGLRMMLAAMHSGTASLPAVDLAPGLLPEPGQAPFGRTTPQAMVVGVVAAVRGMVHHLIDRYAEFYEAYPRVVATGGDAPLLFDNDPLVEAIVPDLTLIGMAAACRIVASADESEAGAGADGGSATP
jgi:type III pantothenate kinase